jgi:hypothetical protein
MTVHRKEAIETLVEEQCPHEFGVVFSIGNHDYVALHMEGEHTIPPTDRKLNRQHRQILKECIDCPIPATSAYDLNAIDRPQVARRRENERG